MGKRNKSPIYILDYVRKDVYKINMNKSLLSSSFWTRWKCSMLLEARRLSSCGSVMLCCSVANSPSTLSVMSVVKRSCAVLLSPDQCSSEQSSGVLRLFALLEANLECRRRRTCPEHMFQGGDLCRIQHQ